MDFFSDPRPLVEITPVADVYVDGIGNMENLGDTFRTIYFTFARPYVCGPLERVITVRLIRPRRSLLTRDSAMAQWLQRHPAEGERMHS